MSSFTKENKTIESSYSNSDTVIDDIDEETNLYEEGWEKKGRYGKVWYGMVWYGIVCVV
jgi:hypothetical protein